jgi:hypothetical protein
VRLRWLNSYKLSTSTSLSLCRTDVSMAVVASKAAVAGKAAAAGRQQHGSHVAAALQELRMRSQQLSSWAHWPRPWQASYLA